MTKKLMMVVAAVAAAFGAWADTETVGGITWNYTVSDGKASIYNGDWSAAIPTAFILAKSRMI